MKMCGQVHAPSDINSSLHPLNRRQGGSRGRPGILKRNRILCTTIPCKSSLLCGMGKVAKYTSSREQPKRFGTPDGSYEYIFFSKYLGTCLYETFPLLYQS
jgi:hypothetical protein